MAYTKDEVLKMINRFRKEIEGMLHTDRVYLFGSYATGHAKDYSDIDVAIVSADITDENYFDMKSKIFKKAVEMDSHIEPLCFSKEEFDNDWLPIVPEIKRTGVEVST